MNYFQIASYGILIYALLTFLGLVILNLKRPLPAPLRKAYWTFFIGLLFGSVGLIGYAYLMGNIVFLVTSASGWILMGISMLFSTENYADLSTLLLHTKPFSLVVKKPSASFAPILVKMLALLPILLAAFLLFQYLSSQLM